MEELPLDEAVAKGLIPCASCGAKGAAVQRVDGKPHFLCGKCASRRPLGWIGGLLGVAAFALALWWLAPKGDPQVDWLKHVDALMRQGKFAEARPKIEAQVKAMPGNPGPLVLLGHCLLNLGYVEGALAAFTKAVEADPDGASLGALWIGISLQRLGRAAEALPPLETPFAEPAMEQRRRLALAECLMDLERYDEALKLLGEDSSVWGRHRALRYGGKEKEAEALLTKLAPREALPFRVTRLREEGDFDGARAAIEAWRKEHPEDRWKAARADFSVAVEAGDIPRAVAAAEELAGAPDVQLRGEGLAYRVPALLLAGRRDEALAAAADFLDKTDPELSAIRLERLQMLHLTGKASTSDVEAEAKRVSRVRANDLYWFLAAASGDRAWAEKGLGASPGRNFPYHSLKRLAGK